jgi:thiosulfate/3-mercaptopyruvate sulfurtransferase
MAYAVRPYASGESVLDGLGRREEHASTMKVHAARLALLLITLMALPMAGRADALSAAQTREALALGAVAWDIRAQAATSAVLPGAAAADLRPWLAGGGASALAHSVSAAGIDLSREVVLYGAAGDPLAQALYAALGPLARGRVHWFVGGIDEWQAAGLPTVTQLDPRRPVPQRLVARPADETTLAPAAPNLRQPAGRSASLAALAR